MKKNGNVVVDGASFRYTLVNLDVGNAKHMINPQKNVNKDRYHIQVVLSRSDGVERTVYMHPTGSEGDNLDTFVEECLRRAFEQFDFVDLPSRFDRPGDTETERCPWC